MKQFITKITNRQTPVSGQYGGSESGQLPVFENEHSSEDLSDRQLVGAGLSGRRHEEVELAVALREGPRPADGLTQLLISLVHFVHRSGNKKMNKL